MALPELRPIRARTVQDAIYEELSLRLRVGKFAPGEFLRLGKLAELFGTSIQPVREATQRLIAVQALMQVTNRGTRVPKMSVQDFHEFADLRKVLMVHAADRATVRMNEPEIEALEAIVTDTVQSLDDGNIDLSVELNFAFYHTLGRAGGSEQLAQMIEGLALRLGPVYGQSLKRVFASEAPTMNLHRALVDAIRGRDRASATRVMENILDKNTSLVLKFGDL